MTCDYVRKYKTNTLEINKFNIAVDKLDRMIILSTLTEEILWGLNHYFHHPGTNNFYNNIKSYVRVERIKKIARLYPTRIYIAKPLSTFHIPMVKWREAISIIFRSREYRAISSAQC